MFNWLCLLGTVQYMVAPLQEQLLEYYYTGVTLEEQHFSGYYSW